MNRSERHPGSGGISFVATSGILGCALCVPGLWAGRAVVDAAWYEPDTGPRYAWSEKAAGLTDFSERDLRAGHLFCLVRNVGSAPVQVRPGSLNGKSLAELRRADARSVIWWRAWPAVVPSGHCTEVSIRLRRAPVGESHLGLSIDGEPLEVVVPADPPPFRIATVAWPDARKRLLVVLEKTAGKRVRVVRVFVDGVDVTRAAEIPAPEFFNGVCPVLVTLESPFEIGSFHTVAVEAAGGVRIGRSLRTLPEFLRLGMYGAGDLEQNLVLGINTAAHFRALNRAGLEKYRRFGLRAAFHIGNGVPAPDVRGHPAVYAYLLRDEPDCWDYRAKDWPAAQRIGYHAQELVDQLQKCVQADPKTPVMSTLDLTFKPANYYVYAQLPDIVSPDCYALTVGQPLRFLRQVIQTCRRAAGPRRVDAVVQVDFEDRKKEDMRFRRPPFPAEVVIEYLYALGAGARGFSGWEWFDEDAGWCVFHGARNFPDVLAAVRDVYRRFAFAAPLILSAHPACLVRCDRDDVWLRTLVCGLDALLVVVVNETYESRPDGFRWTPLKQVEFRVPDTPWLSPEKAGVITGDGALKPLPVERARGELTVRLSELNCGALLLVTADEGVVRRLVQRYEKMRQQAAVRLLAARERKLREDGRAAVLSRAFAAAWAKYAIRVTRPLNAYFVKEPTFFSVDGERWNGIEWWTDATPRGGEWEVEVKPGHTDGSCMLYFQRARWWGGGWLRVEVEDASGKWIHRVDRPDWSGPVPHVPLRFPRPGRYRIRVLHEGKGKPGGRLGVRIWLVPEGAVWEGLQTSSRVLEVGL